MCEKYILFLFLDSFLVHFVHLYLLYLLLNHFILLFGRHKSLSIEKFMAIYLTYQQKKYSSVAINSKTEIFYFYIKFLKQSFPIILGWFVNTCERHFIIILLILNFTWYRYYNNEIIIFFRMKIGSQKHLVA